MIKDCEGGCKQEIKRKRRCVNGHRNKIAIKKWTKEELIIYIQELFNNHKLKKSDFWENSCLYGLPSITIITKFFNNLNNLASECNIEFAKRDRAKYLIENPEVKNKILKNNKIFHKGTIKTKQHRKNLSISCKGRIPFNKDKTYKEMFGLEKANKIREHNIKIHTKYSEQQFINNIQNIFKKYGQITKTQFNKYNKLCNIETIRYRFGSLNNLAKCANIKFKFPEIIFANQYNRKKGNNEDIILDFIERIYDLNLIRHPIVFTKKTFRFPDAIDYKNKIIYEVDEHYHNRQKIQDKLREDEILELYPEYKFIRLNEKEFLNSLN